MNWQNLFQKHILTRELGYYENGYVSEITGTKNEYEAGVSGRAFTEIQERRLLHC